MDRHELIALLSHHGAETVLRRGFAEAGIVAALQDGWDFTDWRWQMSAGGGMVLCYRYRRVEREDAERLRAARDEARALEQRTAPAWHMYQYQREREAYAAQMRLNELAHELIDAGIITPGGITSPPLAMRLTDLLTAEEPTEGVLVVFGDPARRAEFAAAIPADNPYPVELFMAGSAAEAVLA